MASGAPASRDDRIAIPTSDQPTSLQTWDETPSAGLGAVRRRRFEYTSRGDRVPGRLLLPETGDGPFPLVLLQHGAGGSKDAPYMEAAGPWARGGAAIASIDFPLHGDRSSPKLSERLLENVHLAATREGHDALDPRAQSLLAGFAEQSLCDLATCIDALGEVSEVDTDRVVYASFSLGSLVGAVFCGLDPRPRAAALALAGGGFGPASIDPARYVGLIAPRPLLIVGATRDELISRDATEHLFGEAGEPKQIEWFDSSHQTLPGNALKAMWQHLRGALEIE